MLHLVTKRELWSVTRETAIERLNPEPQWHQKNAQDAIALEVIGDVAGKKIGEIGGGHSRTLPLLRDAAERINIDKLEGKLATGSGPKSALEQAGVQIVRDYVGAPMDWSPNYFDVLYSVSVVEHIPLANLAAFFADCHRLLKPGGLMVHLIDIYLEDDPKANASQIAKAKGLIEGFKGFMPLGPIMSIDDVKFSCSLVSNPDDTMTQWNRIAPALKDLRERAQSCTLLMAARKP